MDVTNVLLNHALVLLNVLLNHTLILYVSTLALLRLPHEVLGTEARTSHPFSAHTHNYYWAIPKDIPTWKIVMAVFMVFFNNF